MGLIRYFAEDTPFSLKQKRLTSSWIIRVIENSGFQLKQINFIFCSDDYLLGINKQYLNHNTFTDIITFPYSSGKQALEADIYISIDRVKENALKHKEAFQDELHRVMIHGVLHLLGYKDKSPSQKATMRKKEAACLSLR